MPFSRRDLPSFLSCLEIRRISHDVSASPNPNTSVKAVPKPIAKASRLRKPECKNTTASPNPDVFHRLRRMPRSTLEKPSGNARIPVTLFDQLLKDGAAA